jgi:hypothetical protein
MEDSHLHGSSALPREFPQLIHGSHQCIPNSHQAELIISPSSGSLIERPGSLSIYILSKSGFNNAYGLNGIPEFWTRIQGFVGREEEFCQ